MVQSLSCNSRIWLMKKESTGNTYFLTSDPMWEIFLSSHGIFVKFRNNRAKNRANIRERTLSKNGQVIFVGVFVSTMGDNYH